MDAAAVIALVALALSVFGTGTGIIWKLATAVTHLADLKERWLKAEQENNLEHALFRKTLLTHEGRIAALEILEGTPKEHD